MLILTISNHTTILCAYRFQSHNAGPNPTTGNIDRGHSMSLLLEICYEILPRSVVRSICILIDVTSILGYMIILFFLIVRLTEVIVVVTDTSLTQFNYTNNTLHFNLAFNMTIHNPNTRLGIYYDIIEARALYQDARFDSDNLTPFYQLPKAIDYLNHTFQGQQLLMLGPEKTSEFNKEKSDGAYNIDVNLYIKRRYKFGLIETGKLKLKVKCQLKVPLTTNGTKSGTAFKRIICYGG